MSVTALYSILYLIKLVNEYFRECTQNIEQNQINILSTIQLYENTRHFNIWNFITFRTKPRLQFKL